MGFKRDDATGGLIWDKSTASERWGKNAKRPDFVEMAERSIEAGMLMCVWDTLADPARRRDLADDEERMIVRKALRRSVEKGRMHASTAAVLISLIGGSDRLKTENKVNHSAIRAAAKANPNISLSKLSQKFGCSRSTAQAIKRDVLSTD
jgi:hypothetical protein